MCKRKTKYEFELVNCNTVTLRVIALQHYNTEVSKQCSIRVGHQKLNSLIFQDDISKMNDDLNQAIEGCDKIDDTLRKKLLSVNYDKSKYLLMGNNRFRKSIQKKLKKRPMTMGGVEIVSKWDTL